MAREFNSIADYLEWLKQQLAPHYGRDTAPGHDMDHVLRMVARVPDIVHLPDLDREELVAAILLHNLDRAPGTNSAIVDVVDRTTAFMAEALRWLQYSPFDDEARQRIAQAAAAHSKKYDDPDDSDVLKALRALDKVDRLGLLGILTAAMVHGLDKPLYVVRSPLRFELEEPGGWPLSVYDDIVGRLMQWPLLLPEEARYLIDTADMRAFVAYARALADQICRTHGLENGIEADLMENLGPELYALYAA